MGILNFLFCSLKISPFNKTIKASREVCLGAYEICINFQFWLKKWRQMALSAIALFIYSA